VNSFAFYSYMHVENQRLILHIFHIKKKSNWV